jgi:hypothetical protein
LHPFVEDGEGMKVWDHKSGEKNVGIIGHQKPVVKHSPGPWTIEEYGDDDAPTLVIHKDSDMRVCFMATPGEQAEPTEIEANARLIAAAPDMLEALRWVETRMLGRLPDHNTMTKQEIAEYDDAFDNKIRAAIAKATAER